MIASQSILKFGKWLEGAYFGKISGQVGNVMILHNKYSNL